MERITVSPNKRFLVTASGTPFFWMGDTAWELFHRLNREEARIYLANRAQHGFSVIQAVVLAELDGLNTPNADGDCPLIDNDPTRLNEPYFRLVDDVIRLAAEYGLYIGLLPTWADKVNVPFGGWQGSQAIFNPENAYEYGKLLGARWRDETNLIWILGGDRPPVWDSGENYFDVWRAMAQGLDDGTGRCDFKTYHPNGGGSTSQWLHDEPWLDMHMMQSGHGSGHDVPVWEWVEHDYALVPVRPTLDGEPNYEDHPVDPWPSWDPRNGYFRDFDVRKQLYRSVFAGACGVTYGHHFIWQMYSPLREPVNNGNELIPWYEAIHRPGAAQVKHLRRLMESRPFLTRIPDQRLVLGGSGAGAQHVRATRDDSGRYALVYVPRPHPVTVDLDRLSGEQVRAWWYDPVSGAATLIDVGPRAGERTFCPPGHRPDWVLVLDDVAAGFPAPGVKITSR
ncbi:MAG: DUF4038 domain-containing protein [Chloroflexi bacterium]|nr:DUF4038 domain-containing protein [Chloroflexota bacterium]